MAEYLLRITRKWLEGAAGLRLETMTQSFAKGTGKRADELISGSLRFHKLKTLQKIELLLKIWLNNTKVNLSAEVMLNMANISYVKEKQKFLLVKAARRAGIAGLLFMFTGIAASFILPWWITWENGPVEMLQNAILAEAFFLCFYYYIKDKRTASLFITTEPTTPTAEPNGAPRSITPYISRNIWIAGMLIFLLAFGREISWGRVFFLQEMGRFGPSFVDQSQLSYFPLIRPVVIAVAVAALVSFIRWFPRQAVFRQIPFPRLVLAAICAAAAFAQLADADVLNRFIGHGAATAIEEFTELDVYFMLLFLTWYYHKWFVLLNKEAFKEPPVRKESQI